MGTRRERSECSRRRGRLPSSLPTSAVSPRRRTASDSPSTSSTSSVASCLCPEPRRRRGLLLQTCGRCQQSSLELTGWSRGVVESWSRGVVELCRSLGLLGLRDGYLSGPFSFLVL